VNVLYPWQTSPNRPLRPSASGRRADIGTAPGPPLRVPRLGIVSQPSGKRVTTWAAEDNFTLLCGRCNHGAPNVADPAAMWAWAPRHESAARWAHDCCPVPGSTAHAHYRKNLTHPGRYDPHLPARRPAPSPVIRDICAAGPRLQDHSHQGVLSALTGLSWGARREAQRIQFR
jgi:hypothetical protein